MDYVLTQYDAVPGGRVKLAATVQLALGLVASIWQPSLGGAAVAVLGERRLTQHGALLAHITLKTL